MHTRCTSENSCFRAYYSRLCLILTGAQFLPATRCKRRKREPRRYAVFAYLCNALKSQTAHS